MAAFEPFEIEKKNFASLLDSFVFEVPDLQRPFAWTPVQADDLVRDVLGLVDELKANPDRHPQPQHFIGTIVTITTGARSRVIDGQQRLTTTTLLLGLVGVALDQLQTKVNKLKDNHPQKAGLNYRVGSLLAKVKDMLFTIPYDPVGNTVQLKDLRFSPSPEVSKTFFSLVTGGDGKVDPNEKLPASQLREIAKILNKDLIREKTRFADLEEAAQIDHLQRVLEAVTKHLIFVWVDTKSSSAGYQLFESLNATGKPLNVLDLLKVWMLAVLEGTPQASQVGSQFRELSNDDDKEAKEFLIDYYRAKTFSNSGKPSDKELSLVVRGRLFKDANVPIQYRSDSVQADTIEDRIAGHVAMMTKWQNPWRDLRDGKIPYSTGVKPFDAERYSLLVKDVLKHSLAIPLFMQAAEHLPVDQFGKLVHLIERVFFRYKTICGGPVSALEKEYQSATRILDTNRTLDLNVFANSLSQIVGEYAPDQVFEIQLQEKLVYGKQSARLNYFLQTLDLYEANPKPARVAQKDLRFTLEHINPQNPGTAQPLSDELLHCMGNICLLTFEENLLLGNEDFGTKKSKIRNGFACTEVLTRDVFADERTVWDEDAVLERKQKLIQKAKSVFVAQVF